MLFVSLKDFVVSLGPGINLSSTWLVYFVKYARVGLPQQRIKITKNYRESLT